MPGAYAHITAVGKAAEGLAENPSGLKPLVLMNTPYVQLGALGPDFPYLDLYHRSDKEWADAMHYQRTGERILKGIAAARGMQGSERAKALAWLLGFTGHVVADVTIHPVVKLKVGPYEGNETEHRRCEMHQDVYIFTTQSGLDFHKAEFLKTLTDLCADPGNPFKLHPAVSYLWIQMFKGADGALFSRNEPNIDAWYYWFKTMVGGITDDRFFGLARHVLPWLEDLIYPLPADVNRTEYIDALATPRGVQSYDEVFDRAVGHIREAWTVVGSDVLTGSNLAQGFLHDWNLDEGTDETGNLTFWS